MEEQNTFPCHSCRLAFKPPLPPEVTFGRRRRSQSLESSTIRTFGEKSFSNKSELAQVVSTHPGLSTVVETDSSQLPMVMIQPISETIPPGPDVVQPEVDLDPVSFFPEHLNLEVEKPEVFPALVIPQIFVAIESPISHSQPHEIYFGLDGKILPPGLISIEERPQDEKPLTPTHFGVEL